MKQNTKIRIEEKRNSLENRKRNFSFISSSAPSTYEPVNSSLREILDRNAPQISLEWKMRRVFFHNGHRHWPPRYPKPCMRKYPREWTMGCSLWKGAYTPNSSPPTTHHLFTMTSHSYANAKRRCFSFSNSRYLFGCWVTCHSVTDGKSRRNCPKDVCERKS
ncbi:hypothetical protein CDAR_281111 [Caerostris darwini]|uniref:Uncharacterized protein n=1 Tax=Caerostris darwini TaxID=1538125 RepID=A0AAV4NFB8_9ARAC|nr:hypothetical protein CDAR_281111 [Caerostris darwini]